MPIFQTLRLHTSNYCEIFKSNVHLTSVSTYISIGGLQIPIEVTMYWEDEWAMEILRRKTDQEVSYPFGETVERHFELNS